MTTILWFVVLSRIGVYLQHTLLGAGITMLTGIGLAVLGSQLSKRLTKIEIHVNGRLSKLENRMDRLENAPRGPDPAPQAPQTRTRNKRRKGNA